MSVSIALQNLRAQLKQNHHRALVVLSGSLEWQTQQLATLWTNSETLLWAGKVPAAFAQHAQTIKPSQYPHLLGQEVDSVVIDSRDGFSANGLGILSGMVRAGGLLVFLTDSKDKWAPLPNPENQRFLNTPYLPKQAFSYFNQHLETCFMQYALWLSQDDTDQQNLNVVNHFIADRTAMDAPKTSIPTPLQTLPTPDQLEALQNIDTVAFGHRKRPLVISADRGRGKTSVLGMAAIELLLKGKQHIVLTASRYQQASVAFEQAIAFLNTFSVPVNRLVNKPGLVKFDDQHTTKTFEFIAPDQLILTPTSADVLMVDEAAHLPTALLNTLLSRHHRLVFATTLHGYEGSGRGFELRFKKTLKQQTPNWKNLHLHTPIRWAENDPLEIAINSALLLTNPANNLDQIDQIDKVELNQALDSLDIQQISTAQLAQTPDQLNKVFNLLVSAHYQTSPDDLQQLLTSPHLTLFIARAHNQILGVALCTQEGKILAQNKRLHGHLVPQLLVKHYSSPSFFMLSTWRVMRIAVHPSIQNKGIGKQLLSFVKNAAKQARIDYVSSSFGATDELLSFWLQQNFTPLHVGVKRDKASGNHNLVVTHALSAMAQQALALIQRGFQAQFPHLLMESLPHFSDKMVLAIHKTFRYKQPPHHLQQTLLDYQTGQRAYESISGQLWKWSIRHPHIISQANAQHRAVWCDKILKKHPWKEVAHRHHLAGRKGVETVLKEMILQTLKNPS